MTHPDHFDQISPTGGVQLQPDGTLAAAPDVAPLGETWSPDDVAPPSLPPEFLDEQHGQELAVAVAAQIEADRQRLTEPAGNVDIKGAPHFQLIREDGDVCGQDGQPWPCAGAKQIGRDLWEHEYGDQTPEEPGYGRRDQQVPTFDQVAAALGVSPGSLLRQVAAQEGKITRGLTRDV